MTALVFDVMDRRDRLGVKGPRAAEWLVTQGIVLPMAPNSWTHSIAAGSAAAAGDSDALLVARLGSAEFFLEDASAGTTLRGISPALAANPPGVYPVLREDSAFQLSGAGVHEVLAQVCNVQFAALSLDAHAVIMTLMIGVAVLVVPQMMHAGTEAERRYRIWCDPTFGPSLIETLGVVVVECGGIMRRVPA
jgi:sarcosine oxidase, subunit gamma